MKRTFYGMQAFTVYAVGQLISLIGSSLTGFALTVWLYQKTGSVTPLAINAVCLTLPGILIAPIAGSLVDRWDRRVVIIVSDTAAAITTFTLFWLLTNEQLLTWHIYLAAVITSLSTAFQQPAFTASIPLLVPKEHLGRANGVITGANALAQIIAPVVAGFLLITIELRGVMLIDFVTYLASLIALSLVRFPKPEKSDGNEHNKGSIWREAAYGWAYITTRPGLLRLMLFFACTNFVSGLITILVTPLILSTASPTVLGTIMTVGGFGMLAGALTMGIWGGPQKRVVGIFGGMFVIGLCIIAIGLPPSILLYTVAGFIFFFCLPIMDGSTQALFQTKVAADVQGRFFALSGMIATAARPIANLVAGPLADNVYEPLMRSDGVLGVTLIGNILGTGTGRGIGLLFINIGILTLVLVGVTYWNPNVRFIETELPDAILEGDNTRLQRTTINENL